MPIHTLTVPHLMRDTGSLFVCVELQSSEDVGLSEDKMSAIAKGKLILWYLSLTAEPWCLTGKGSEPPSHRMTIYVEKDRDPVCKYKDLSNTYLTVSRNDSSGREHQVDVSEGRRQ